MFAIGFDTLLLAIREDELRGQVYAVETYPMVGEKRVLWVLHEGKDRTIWVGMEVGLYGVAGGKVGCPADSLCDEWTRRAGLAGERRGGY